MWVIKGKKKWEGGAGCSLQITISGLCELEIIFGILTFDRFFTFDRFTVKKNAGSGKEGRGNVVVGKDKVGDEGGKGGDLVFPRETQAQGAEGGREVL